MNYTTTLWRYTKMDFWCILGQSLKNGWSKKICKSHHHGLQLWLSLYFITSSVNCNSYHSRLHWKLKSLYLFFLLSLTFYQLFLPTKVRKTILNNLWVFDLKEMGNSKWNICNFSFPRKLPSLFFIIENCALSRWEFL